MSDRNIGEILRQRREQLGIPLNVAADSTNIRARMLETFEQGDFGKYPPRGHARGMISSYARFLELDPHTLLDQYETQLKAYESSKEMATSASRTRSGRGRFGESVNAGDKPITRDPGRRTRQSASRRARSAQDVEADAAREAKLNNEMVAEGDDRYKSGSVRVVGTRQTGSFARVGRPRGSQNTRIADESGSDELASTRASQPGSTGRLSYARANSPYRSTRRSSFSADVAQEEAPSSSTPNYFGVDLDEDADSPSRRGARRSSARRRRRNQVETEQESGGIVARVTGMVKEVFSETRTRLIALAAVAVVLAVVIVASILIGTAGNGGGGIISVGGGAEDDSTAKTDSSTATTTVTTSNGNPITVKIAVAQGQTSLIEVKYDDDNAYSGTAVGPWERSFLVTDTLSASIGNPDAVSVTENGNEVSVERTQDGTGIFNLEIKTTSSKTKTSSSDESSGKS